MSARLQAVEQNRERILRAAYDLWLVRPYEHVTLDAVAEMSGFTRQTVLRHFGSKDDLALAVVAWQQPIEEDAREAEPGDVSTALQRLMSRYESMGDANVRMLELEGRIAAIDVLIERARVSHRGWIERIFSPWLPDDPGDERDLMVLALYAATDVTVWKLLRRDFRLSSTSTALTVRRLVDGVISGPDQPDKETT